MNHTLCAWAALCAVCGAVADVRLRRIPNALTYGGLAAALGAQTLLGGGRGLGQAVGGALLAGGALLVVHLVGGMGAGDVKLMAAVGAWLGPAAGARALAYTALAGAALALLYMVAHRRSAKTLRNIVLLLRFHLRAGVRPHRRLSQAGGGTMRIPYGLAIAAGALMVLVSR